MKEQFFLECHFICGIIFAAWNQCSDEDGKIELVIHALSHVIVYIACCIFGSLWTNIFIFTKMLNAMKIDSYAKRS